VGTAEALTRDPTTRHTAATALRRAHDLAVDLQATPLLAEVEALAQSARISLDVIDEGTLAGPTLCRVLLLANVKCSLTSSQAEPTPRLLESW
jgi:hypothetical protein